MIYSNDFQLAFSSSCESKGTRPTLFIWHSSLKDSCACAFALHLNWMNIYWHWIFWLISTSIERPWAGFDIWLRGKIFYFYQLWSYCSYRYKVIQYIFGYICSSTYIFSRPIAMFDSYLGMVSNLCVLSCWTSTSWPLTLCYAFSCGRIQDVKPFHPSLYEGWCCTSIK